LVTVKAPAKINLTLEVLRRRDDGYHEIKSVMQTIGLYDTLVLEKANSINYQVHEDNWSAEKSLLSKTIQMLHNATGCLTGVNIKITKEIPMMAGLGGDSSDAAALLRGLNELWGLELPEQKLRDMAGKLGSDVTFFLHGGTAMAEGRGEIITALPAIHKVWVVLAVPDIPDRHGKTARMYQALKASYFTDGSITNEMVKSLHKTGNIKKSQLFNVFENVAFSDGSQINEYKKQFEKLGAPQVHMAGSGPALFTLCDEAGSAKELYKRCKNQGMNAYMVETL
jgi:4-diphosphocytidyl-2-C-methyl-D-erythritol kinase